MKVRKEGKEAVKQVHNLGFDIIVEAIVMFEYLYWLVVVVCVEKGGHKSSF